MGEKYSLAIQMLLVLVHSLMEGHFLTAGFFGKNELRVKCYTCSLPLSEEPFMLGVNLKHGG